MNHSKMSKERVKKGTHNFLGGKIQKETSKKNIANGTHNFLDKEKRKEWNDKLLKEGRHPSQIPRKCPHCSKEGKGSGLFKHHFNNCKFKLTIPLT